MMKHLVTILLSAVILSGCVAASITPSTGEIADIQNIAVFAIEAPPLGGSDLSHENFHTMMTVSSSVLNLNTDPAFRDAGMALGLVNGIILLAEVSEFQDNSSTPVISLDEALNQSDVWMPTVGLAAETALQLRAGWGADVKVVDGYLTLPRIIDRSRTEMMANWLAPLKAWYNDNDSSFGYGQLANKDTDAVLEVGILNYEIYKGDLVIQVMSKLIDPASGRVIGRARQFDMVEVPAMTSFFGNGGNSYKAFFASTTRGMINANLKELGLLP